MSLLSGLFPIATDSEGRTVPGAWLYSYDAGTNTPKALYSNQGLTIEHANPLEADGAGWFEDIYLGAGGYKLVLRDASDTVIKTQDNYYQALDSSDLTNINTDIAEVSQQVSQTGGVYTDSGAADAYVLTISSNQTAPTAYHEGMIITFLPDNANTGASTVNVSGLGLRNLYNESGGALAAAFLENSAYYTFIYTSSNFRFLSKGGLVDEGYIASSAVTAAKIATNAVTTDKILAKNVTVAKMADGTAYKQLGYDVNGVVTEYSNTMRLLTSGSFTAAASLQFVLSTLDATQSVDNCYLVRFVGVQPASDDQELWLTLSSDAGSTYASTNYESVTSGSTSQNYTTVIGVNYTAAAQMVVAGGTAANSLSNAANETAFVEMLIAYCNTGTSARPHITTRAVYASAAAPYYIKETGGATRTTAADYDAIKFTWEGGGNFAAVGKYYLFKIPNVI